MYNRDFYLANFTPHAVTEHMTVACASARETVITRCIANRFARAARVPSDPLQRSAGVTSQGRGGGGGGDGRTLSGVKIKETRLNRWGVREGIGWFGGGGGDGGGGGGGCGRCLAVPSLGCCCTCL